MVLGGTAVRTRSSTGTAWMNTNSSGGGKKGSSFWPKFNSTTQFLQRTWGRRARSARDSLLIRNATPRPSPFLEKESSTSSASKFYNKRQEHLWAHRACSWLISQLNLFSPYFNCYTTMQAMHQLQKSSSWWDVKGSPAPSIHSMLQPTTFRSTYSKAANDIILPKSLAKFLKLPILCLESSSVETIREFILT